MNNVETGVKAVRCPKCNTIVEYVEKHEPMDFSGCNVPPPLGIAPEWLWKERRFIEIVEATKRFRKAGKVVPNEWYVEAGIIMSNSGDKISRFIEIACEIEVVQ